MVIHATVCEQSDGVCVWGGGYRFDPANIVPIVTPDETLFIFIFLRKKERKTRRWLLQIQRSSGMDVA